jgi:hypothetical protein
MTGIRICVDHERSRGCPCHSRQLVHQTRC